jgi:hypothetical protein
VPSTRRGPPDSSSLAADRLRLGRGPPVPALHRRTAPELPLPGCRPARERTLRERNAEVPSPTPPRHDGRKAPRHGGNGRPHPSQRPYLHRRSRPAGGRRARRSRRAPDRRDGATNERALLGGACHLTRRDLPPMAYRRSEWRLRSEWHDMAGVHRLFCSGEGGRLRCDCRCLERVHLHPSCGAARVPDDGPCAGCCRSGLSGLAPSPMASWWRRGVLDVQVEGLAGWTRARPWRDGRISWAPARCW